MWHIPLLPSSFHPSPLPTIITTVSYYGGRGAHISQVLKITFHKKGLLFVMPTKVVTAVNNSLAFLMKSGDLIQKGFKTLHLP